MIDLAMTRCGPWFGPLLLALSIIVWGLGIAMLLAAVARNHDVLPRIDALLRRLAAICTQVGLLGTVVGMIRAFGANGAAQLDPELTRALGLCFWTTAIGAFHALVANGFTFAAAAIAAAGSRPTVAGASAGGRR